jgi:hypothetical protein
MRRFAFAAFMALAVSAPVHALEPKKPSQLVTLVPSAPCENGEGLLYGNRVNPDGTHAPFTIPPKQVLVLKRWSFVFNGGGGAASATAALQVEGATSALARVYFPFDADGRGGGATELSAVVGEGETLCGFHTSGIASTAPFDGFVEGYLTKAK